MLSACSLLSHDVRKEEAPGSLVRRGQSREEARVGGNSGVSGDRTPDPPVGCGMGGGNHRNCWPIEADAPPRELKEKKNRPRKRRNNPIGTV